MKSLGLYLIVYSNGMTQEKNLISHKDYINVILPKKEQIYNAEMKKDYETSSSLKKELLADFGDEWFTDKSPMFDAIDTGMLILGKYSYKCTIKKLK